MKYEDRRLKALPNNNDNTLTEYDKNFIDNLEINEDDIECEWEDEDFIPETRQFVISIHHKFYDKEAELIKQKILQAFDKLGKIGIYVRILQEGDPENENPKKILDYIDEILERKI